MGETMTTDIDSEVAARVFGAVLRDIDGEPHWMVNQGPKQSGGDWWVYLSAHITEPRLWGPDFRYNSCPYFTRNAAADFAVLVKVRETWDEERLRLFADALWRMWYDRAAADVEDSRSMDSLPYAEYRVGDYSRAALAALRDGGG